MTSKDSSAKTVKSARPSKVSLTLYQAGNAVVREQRDGMNLSSGKREVLFEGMPSQFVQGSLVVVGIAEGSKFKVGPISYRSPNLTNDNILKRSVGSPIVVVDQHGNRQAGTIEHVLNNQLYIRQDSGASIVLSVASNFELPKGLPEGLTASASLLLQPEALADTPFGLKILYEAGQLSWSGSRYNAFYDAKSERFTRLDCWVELTNKCGTSFRDAVVKLLSGTNIGRQAKSAHRAFAAPRMAAASLESAGYSPGFAADEAAVESVGESKQYTLPGDVSLDDGETKWFCLFSAEDVPAKSELYLPNGYYSEGVEEADVEKQPLNVRLRLKNNTASKLDKPMPASSEFIILQKDSSGEEQKTDTATIGAVACGEDFKVELNNRSTDVKARRVLTAYKEDPREPEDEETQPVKPSRKKKEKKPRFREESREIIVDNFKKDKEVEVIVYEALPANAEVLEQSHQFEAKKNDGSSFHVKVPAAGQTTIRYRIKWRVE